MRKISPPPGFDPRTVQPVAIRYSDCAIPAHGICLWGLKTNREKLRSRKLSGLRAGHSSQSRQASSIIPTASLYDLTLINCGNLYTVVKMIDKYKAQVLPTQARYRVLCYLQFVTVPSYTACSNPANSSSLQKF